ncbi:MAG: hypothetical protein M3209_01025 [Acidobacteriota bacterium]|nr:hypothetical protein [Acidobacteriota bacterium]
MSFLLLIVIVIALLWLLARSNHSGRRLDEPPVAVKQLDNKKPATVIKPNQPVVVKPQSEVITVRPSQSVFIKPASAVVIQPGTREVLTVQPTRTLTVAPPERGAWDERGWTRNQSGNGEIYEGYYRVRDRKYRGRIETRSNGRKVSAYIYNPPREVKRHRHGACFQLVKDDWFHLHWSRPARTVDDAILYMERILDESLRG